MCGIKKLDSFIKFNSCRGLAPEYFRVFDDHVEPLIERKFSTLPHSDIVSSKIPRLLLRPLYRLNFEREKKKKKEEEMKNSILYHDENIKDPELILKIFDTFSNHMDYIREESEKLEVHETFQSILSESLLCENFSKFFLFGFSKEVIEGIQDDLSNAEKKWKTINDFSIFLTLFLRIYFLSYQIQYMSTLIQTEAYYDIHHNLNLFLDCHIPLSSMIKNMNIYRDDQLLDPGNNPFHICKPIVFQFFPKDVDFFEHSDTFDIWQSIYNSGRKCQENERSKSSSDLSHAISQKILTKIGVFTCQKRGLTSAVIECIKKFPDIFLFIRRCIYISLTGNIEYSKSRPSFPVKCILWEFIFKPENSFERDIFEFVQKYEVTLLFILREFIVYYCTVDPVYSEFIREFVKQDQIEFLTKKFMEEIRKILNSSMSDVIKNQSESGQSLSTPLLGLFRDSCLGKVEKYANEKYTQFLPFGSKFSKSIPEIYFLKTMETKHREEIPDKNSNRNEEDTDYIDHKRLCNILAVVEHIHDSGAMHLREFFYTKWLKYLGVSKESFVFIRNLYFRYCCEDLPDNSLSREIRKLWILNQKDFHIIRIYLKQLVRRYNFIRYSLPEDIYLLQKQCNERKLGILFKDDNCGGGNSGLFDDDLHYCYFCENCQKWANNVIRPNDPNSKRTMSSFTPSSGAIDMVTENFVCLRATDSKFPTLEKKKQTSDDVFRINTMKKKEEKRFLCSKIPLQKVNMNGILQKIGKIFYCKCTLCDCLMEFNASCFGIYGLTCGNHSDLVSPLGQSMKEFGSVDFLSSNLTFQELNEERCFSCGQNSNWDPKSNTPRNRIYSIKIIDDSDRNNMKLSDVFLCKEELSKYGGRTTTLPLLSSLKKSLTRNLGFEFEKKCGNGWWNNRSRGRWRGGK